jgi:16S rRNA (guanine527-N7)-methyltransferase
LSPPLPATVERFLELLGDANRHVNLVSRRLTREELRGHAREALEALPLLPSPRPGRGLRLLDLGSGGGFPAIPILLARLDIEGVLVESTAKKGVFLRHAIRELGLTAEVVNARFPGAFPMRDVPRFDILTSRAVADAGTLVRTARPILSPGAVALLWTSGTLAEEAARTAGVENWRFQRTPGAERRGIAVLECST